MDREAKKIAKEQEQAGQTLKSSSVGASPVTVPTATATATATVAEKKDYAECKIQVRQTDGKSMVHIFKANEQLAAVRLWIEMNRTDSDAKFQLMQTFPKKIFTDDDMFRNLTELGLTPASSLVISKI